MRRIDDEIYGIEGNIQYNEMALNNLREPFNSVKENVKINFAKVEEENFEAFKEKKKILKRMKLT